jgi:hypothetical protein
MKNYNSDHYDLSRQEVHPIIRNRHPELVSGSMGYPKSEMLKKFQHDGDIAKGSIFDYGLWSIRNGLKKRRNPDRKHRAAKEDERKEEVKEWLDFSWE